MYAAYSNEAIIENLAIFLAGAFIAFCITIFPFILLCYIFSSIGYSRFAKNLGVKNRILAWVPFARNWTLGAIADAFDDLRGVKRRQRIFLLCGGLGKLLGWFFAIIMFIFSTVFTAEAMGVDLGVFEVFYGAYDREIIIPMIITYFVTGVVYVVYFKVAYHGLRLITVHKIFEAVRPRACYIHTILGMLIPMYRAICIMKFSNTLPQEQTPALPQAAPEEWYEQ